MHKDPLSIPTDFVKSSNIDSIGYDNASRTMIVAFKNRSVYAYHPVTQAGYESLRTADSVGKHFHAHFKNNKLLTVEKIN